MRGEKGAEQGGQSREQKTGPDQWGEASTPRETSPPAAPLSRTCVFLEKACLCSLQPKGLESKTKGYVYGRSQISYRTNVEKPLDDSEERTEKHQSRVNPRKLLGEGECWPVFIFLLTQNNIYILLQPSSLKNIIRFSPKK